MALNPFAVVPAHGAPAEKLKFIAYQPPVSGGKDRVEDRGGGRGGGGGRGIGRGRGVQQHQFQLITHQPPAPTLPPVPQFVAPPLPAPVNYQFVMDLPPPPPTPVQHDFVINIAPPPPPPPVPLPLPPT
jgi:hypothetical protein